MDKIEPADIANCPHCTKIIFKDAVFECGAMFSTRCPHCNKSVRVIVKHKVEITMIAVQDERRSKKVDVDPSLIVLILVLYLPPIIHHLVDNVGNLGPILT
jgi:DNA-directed RNA polymerase subunit RPC12/RpoP